MIFIALGTHERPFKRLVGEMSSLIRSGRINEKVVAQLGYTKEKIYGAECHDFMPQNSMDDCLRTCRVMVTHGGLGFLITGLKLGKAIVAVPRLREYGEHTDDHQLQLVKELASQGKITPVYEIRDLGTAIRGAKAAAASGGKRAGIFHFIKNDLDSWAR